jgi:hypothetical protein
MKTFTAHYNGHSVKVEGAALEAKTAASRAFEAEFGEAVPLWQIELRERRPFLARLLALVWVRS